MPEDVRQALERFQRFVERFRPGSVIDRESGFSVADGMLIAGEIALHARRSDTVEEDPID